MYNIYDQRQKVLKWVLVTCLSGDTIIPCSIEGEIKFKPISEITDGYMFNKEGILDIEDDLKVLGLTDDLKSSQLPVKRIFKFRSPKKMLLIKLQNGRKMRVTKDHPCYYLKNGIMKFKLGDELAVGDYFPIATKIDVNNKKRKQLNLTNVLRRNLSVEELPLWRAFGGQLKDIISKNYNSIRDSASNDYSNKSIWNWREYSYLPFQYLNHIESNNLDNLIESIGRGRRNGGEIQRIPNTISLDFDLGFLMGYFVGDGNAKNNMVRFAINIEDHDVAAMLQRIIHEKFNLPTNLRKESHANMNLLQVNSIALKRIFEIGFGLSGSAKGGKLDIPDIVLDSNTEMIYGFLSGMIASDGHVSKKRNFIGISTCDSSFARKLGLMLSVLGIEYRLAYSNNIYVIQFRNKRQLEIFFNNGWLKFKHRKRVEDKLRSTSQIREAHIPVHESGLLNLSKRTRSTRNPRITRRECISRKDTRTKIDQIKNNLYKLNNIEKIRFKNIENIVNSDLAFQKIVSIEEIRPTTPYVYCFEVSGGLPGFVIDGNIFTHNCFGYTGYKNARFGRIECHESITAFARELLLDAMEVAEERGYDVLHGIVDSLWVSVKTTNKNDRKDTDLDFEALCSAISQRTGVNIEFEGYYRWIVFLPNKSTGVGALTRYYGLLDSGEFKVRGVELRQRSTPKFFVKLQQELLDTLATADTKDDLLKLVKTDVLGVLRQYMSKLLSGQCDPHELLFAHRVTRAADEYRVFNHRVAALKQLNEEGVTVHPGETVHYVVLNHTSRDPNTRVRVLELMDGTEKYDKSEYVKYLYRIGDSLLRPFGYTEEKLQDVLGKGVQSTLS
jgi:DNA polymerase elongation subunit (family B)